ncbi:MAG: acyl-CoA carboxylase subunit beta [Actinomycetaceae bacterium]|nr:acyl-CoA carboxylase subunit beta [Actinomycetaceae bacterium]
MSVQHLPAERTVSKDREDFKDFRTGLVKKAEDLAAERQHPKEKLTARERLTQLLDEDTFVEVGQFWGGDINKGFTGAGVITGYGKIDGRKVAVYSQDFSVRGGTLGEAEGDKILHVIDLAMQMKVPIIALLDSGGARIQEGVVALSQYGRIFKKTCQASGYIPQVSVILGPCAGGAVYGPALTDFIIMTRSTSHMFVTGPDVVKAATGENVSFEELGGAELHNLQSGVSHYLAEDEADALDYTRALFTYLPSNCDEAPPSYAYTPTEEDQVLAQRLSALVPASPKQPYDMVEVIGHIVDYGEFVQVQELFASRVIVGFACIGGESVGIVANQPQVDAGTLDIDASEKAARFVRFCDSFAIPIVTLVDVPGYRPGTQQEQAGIIRRGAKLISSYANATVPMVTIVLRKAYGGAYIVMGSKSIGADFNFVWPDAEIAVMGAEGAVSIMNRREIKAAVEQGKTLQEATAELARAYAEENINPSLSLQRGEMDAIIAPSETRKTIIAALELAKTKDRSYHGIKRHENGPL